MTLCEHERLLMNWCASLDKKLTPMDVVRLMEVAQQAAQKKLAELRRERRKAAKTARA